MDSLPTIFPYISITLLGLVLGSFATALIHRIPAKQKIWNASERSKCPSCGLRLRAKDLIPVFSWLWQKGRCRYCQAKISARYPLAEILTAAMAVMFYISNAQSLYAFVPLIAAAPCLVALIFIDLEHKILPNILILILGAIGLVRLELIYLAGQMDISSIALEYLGGAALFMALGLAMQFAFKKFANKDALGMGDVKFFALSGLWLGLSNVGIFFILSGVFGVILGAAWKTVTKQAAFPFGPALITAFFLILCLDGSLLFEKAVKYL